MTKDGDHNIDSESNHDFEVRKRIRERHRQFFGTAPVNPNFNRRCASHDYSSRCIYMITMIKEVETPILSVVRGQRNDKGKIYAWTTLTEAGLVVKKELERLVVRYPALKILTKAIMPDHIHVEIFCRERLKKDLGYILSEFMASCTTWLKNLPEYQGKDEVKFFIKGFNDKICWGRGTKDAFYNYIADNPRRYFIKKNFPEFFGTALVLHIAGAAGEERYALYGNAFLLDCPDKVPVKVSSRYSAEERVAWEYNWTECLRSGGVMVSPFINPEEKVWRDRGIEMGCKIILILNNGFSGPRYKPGSPYFDICATGRLLVIAPLDYDTRGGSPGKRECMAMNAFAKRIAEIKAGDYRLSRRIWKE